MLIINVLKKELKNIKKCHFAIFSAAVDDINDTTVQVCLVFPGLIKQKLKNKVANGDLELVDFQTRYSKCTPYFDIIFSLFLVVWDNATCSPVG